MTTHEEYDLDANVTIGLELLSPEINRDAVAGGFDAGKAGMRALIALRDKYPDLDDNTIMIIEQMFCSSMVASLAHCLGADTAANMVQRMSTIAAALLVLEAPQEPMPEGTVAH